MRRRRGGRGRNRGFPYLSYLVRETIDGIQLPQLGVRCLPVLGHHRHRRFVSPPRSSRFSGIRTSTDIVLDARYVGQRNAA